MLKNGGILGIDRGVGGGYTRALYLPQDRRHSSCA